MIILVTGSRNFTYEKTMFRALTSVMNPFGPNTIINGGARGADKLSSKFALHFGWNLEEYPADWRKLGKAAGVIRNMQMIEEAGAEVCLAFPLGKSPGTHDCMRRASKIGIEVRVFYPRVRFV